MSTVMTNGRPRKQLSDQLDRLDGIIDCLADGLTEAVRDAVRDGSRTALKDLLTDALADPDTLGALRQALIPDVAAALYPQASRTAAFLARVRAAAARAALNFVRAGEVVGAAVAARARRTWAAARRSTSALSGMLTVVRKLKAAAAVGVAAGLAAVSLAVFSHDAAVVLSGVGAAGLGFAAHLRLWTRRVTRRLTG